MLPLTDLGKALADLKAYAIGDTKTWVNHHTQVAYNPHEVPRCDGGALAAHDREPRLFAQYLREIFEKYSDKYVVKFPNLRPFTCDLIVTETSTQKQILFELHMSIEVKVIESEGEAVLWHPQHHSLKEDVAGRKFKYFALDGEQWSYALSVPSGSTNVAYLFHYNQLPRSWFGSREKLLSWKTGMSVADFERRFVVRFDDEATAVTQMEAIFRRDGFEPRPFNIRVLHNIAAPILSRSALSAAQNKLEEDIEYDIEVGVTDQSEHELEKEVEDDIKMESRLDEDIEEIARAQGRTVETMDDRHYHGNRMLFAEIRRKKRGILVETSRSTVDRRVYVCYDYSWTDEDCKRYDILQESPVLPFEFPLSTKVVNLAFFCAYGKRASQSTSPLLLSQAVKTLQNTRPCLIVLYPNTGQLQYDPLSQVYLIPSTDMTFPTSRELGGRKYATANPIDDYEVNGMKQLSNLILSLLEGETGDIRTPQNVVYDIAGLYEDLSV